ncbi:MAG: PAS domain S-box protein, partial [Acidobacteriota bacterium]|nr:PAS domain S-box protein [Acidobacteriota bacterium]
MNRPPSSQEQTHGSERELYGKPLAVRYRRVFETAKDGIIVLDGTTAEILEVNERITEMFGHTEDKFVGRKIWDAPPLRSHDVGRRIFLGLQRQEVFRLEADLTNGQGSLLPVEFLANVYDEEGRAVMQCNVRDISERKQTETALRESEERFRLLVQGVRDYAIFLMDARGAIRSWNIAAERVLGYREDEILGKHFSIIFTLEDQQAGVPERELGTAAKKGHSPDERWHVRKDGSQFFASGELTALPGEDGELRGFAKLMRDVTERRKTEEALRQTHKLESIGVLAGGVAHDFNNLLTGILGNASLALESLTPVNPARSMIEDVVTYSKKAADLTRQLLAYAGKGRFHIQRVNLSDLVFEIVKLVRPSVPRKARLLIELAPDLPFIEADANQIQQIVMNLVINAGEAIGEKEGKIRVST